MAHTTPSPTSAPSSGWGTRVRDLMSRRVHVARDHDTLAFASQIMIWRGIRHLPIVDASDALVGIVSDRDLLRHVVEGPAGALPLRDVMKSPVETIGPDADVDEAGAKLAIARIDSLPVVEGGKVVGILTATDLLAERGRLFHKGGPGRIPSAADVMIRRVLVARAGDTLVAAIQKLVAAEVRHLPVVDADFRVVGMLSDRDVRTVVGDPRSVIERRDGAFEDVLVDEVMTPRPRSVQADASVLQIADLLVDERVGAVPVVSSDDRLLGIVSYVDVIGHLTGREVA